MTISTETRTGPQAGYRNQPALGEWEPDGTETRVLIHWWPHPSGTIDGRVDDPAGFGLSGKTCGFRSWQCVRDFFLDRIALQDAERVFQFQMVEHDADPLGPNRKPAAVPTATKPKTKTTRRSRKTTKATSRRRVDPAHGSPAAESAVGPPAPTLADVALSLIGVVGNDRVDFDPDKLQQLADSIKRDGVIQPLVVTPDGDGFRLIAGERRLRAAKLAKLKTVPVVVRRGDGTFGEIDSKAVAMLRFQENEARENLNPIERAAAIAGLVELHGTNKAVADAIGCNASQVSNMVRLLELPEIWQQWVAAGKLAPTSVRPLIPYSSKRPQVLQWLVDRHATAIDDGGFELTEHAIECAVEACTRPVKQQTFHVWTAPRKTDCHFRYDAKKHADLDVEELKVGWRRTEKRAWNVEAFDVANAEPLKMRRAKYKAAAAARTSDKPKTDSKVSKAAQTPFNPRTFSDALCSQLLRGLADMIAEKSCRGRLPLLLAYVAATVSGSEFGPALTSSSESRRLPTPGEVRQALADVSAKKIDPWLLDVLQRQLRHEAGCNFPSDGLDTPGDVVAVARDLMDIDLLAEYVPDRRTLEACEEWHLREIGRKALNLPDEDQPRTLGEIIDWLEVDWPEGHLPAAWSELLV